jgi:CRP-like cAMP-binding protein
LLIADDWRSATVVSRLPSFTPGSHRGRDLQVLLPLRGEEEPMNSPSNGSRNRLLAVLSHADRDLLTPALEAVDLDLRDVLEAPNHPISHVYFVESGLVSVVGAAAPNHRIEVGMVGYEGMTGLSVVLGGDRSVNETLVQSAGSALRISTGSLREMLGASRSLTATLLRYVNVFMVQGSQTALANGRGRLDERLARWLLMWDDRIRPDVLTVTHDFLALLLGVRRQGVTVALHELEGRGLIRSTRGEVRILDREGLERAANGFYGIPEAEYARSMGAGRVRNPGPIPAFTSTTPKISPRI